MEVKFKVYDKLESRLYDWKEKTFSIDSRGNLLVDSKITDARQYVVLFFAGRRDINGVEIFEGDKLQSSHFEEKFVVIWSESELSWMLQDGHSDYHFGLAEYEVVGNIYE